MPPPLSPVPAVTERALKAGAALDPDAFENIVFAAALSSVKDRALELMELVNKGDRLPLDVTTEAPTATVIEPAPFVMAIPVPAVRVDKT